MELSDKPEFLNILVSLRKVVAAELDNAVPGWDVTHEVSGLVIQPYPDNPEMFVVSGTIKPK